MPDKQPSNSSNAGAATRMSKEDSDDLQKVLKVVEIEYMYLKAWGSQKFSEQPRETQYTMYRKLNVRRALCSRHLDLCERRLPAFESKGRLEDGIHQKLSESLATVRECRTMLEQYDLMVNKWLLTLIPPMKEHFQRKVNDLCSAKAAEERARKPVAVADADDNEGFEMVEAVADEGGEGEDFDMFDEASYKESRG